MKRKRRKRKKFYDDFEKWFIELIIGIIIFLLSTITFVNGIKYKRSFDKVEGVIVSEHYVDVYSVIRSGGRYLSSDRYYLYEVNYTIDGKEYYSDKYSNGKSNLKQNDSVTIKYRKDNPTELIDYRDTGTEGFFGIIGGIGFIVFGFIDRKY